MKVKKAITVILAATMASGLAPRASGEVVLAGRLGGESSPPPVNGKIAFTYCPKDFSQDADCEIGVIGPDGRGQRRLTDNYFEEQGPTWSPDGTRIAFASNRGEGQYDIYLMRADGSKQRNITNSPGDDWDASWSPDGKKIAFISDRDRNDDVYLMNPDGTDRTNITDSPALQEGDPSWSPDGTHIAFEVCPNNLTTAGCEVYVMSPDGSGQTNLTVHPAGDENPAWAPDGRRIAFETDRDGNWEIYVMNSDGSGQNNLSSNSATDFEAAWSPDGRKIAFTSNRPSSQVHVMNYDGIGLQEELTGGDGIGDEPSWGPGAQLPRTRLTAGPRSYTTDRTPTFRFTSNEPGATFRCKLDSAPYRPCASPKTYTRQSIGRHEFRVKATDAAGHTDPTPAISKWRIR